MRTAFVEALCLEAAANRDLWLLTGDLGYSVLEGFARQFPERFMNVGVAEQNMISVAAGLAMTGKTVVTYSIVNFTTLRCLEQIRGDVCYHQANVKIAGVGGGFAYGSLGPTHHGIEDLSAICALPGIDVLVPADPHEARVLTREALRRPGPAYLRLGKAGESNIHAAEPPYVRGAMIRVRPGADALIIATGALVKEALAAAALWAATGREAAVWSCPWLRPFDAAAVAAAAAQFPTILVAEEGVATGGLAAAVGRVVGGMSGARARVIEAAVPPEFGPSTLSQKSAWARLGLDAAGLLARLESAPPK